MLTDQQREVLIASLGSEQGEQVAEFVNKLADLNSPERHAFNEGYQPLRERLIVEAMNARDALSDFLAAMAAEIEPYHEGTERVQPAEHFNRATAHLIAGNEALQEGGRVLQRLLESAENGGGLTQWH